MPRLYPEFFQDEQIVWRKTFYSDIDKTIPVDPTTVVFTLESPSGIVYNPSVVNEPGTGVFSSSRIVNEYGLWDWHWKTENPRIVDQGTIMVKQRNVP